jgi:hypothetical protein
MENGEGEYKQQVETPLGCRVSYSIHSSSTQLATRSSTISVFNLQDMHPDEAPAVSAQTTMKEYRKEYREKQKEFLRPANRQRLREEFVRILDVIVKPRSVDMKEFSGSEEEMRRAVEYLYTNDGR